MGTPEVVKFTAADGLRPDIADLLAATRAKLAETAEEVAARAEDTASLLEHAAARGDSERRMRWAAWEREIARIEHRHAAGLRDREDPATFEHLPPRPD